MNPASQFPVLPRVAILSATLIFMIAGLQAATITNPTLFTGPGAIDPAGSRDITISASGSTSKSVLEGLAGFGVVQDFTGIAAGTNVIAFTETQGPDVRISISGTDNSTTSGGHITNTAFLTSGSSGMTLASSNNPTGGAITATIDFGSWNGSTFDSNMNAVSAAAFTLTGPTARFARVTSISATFLSAEGASLSVQTVTPSYGTNPSLYFGYQTEGGQSIGSIELTVNVSAFSTGDTQVILGLDDLGFTTAIPEPSTAAVGLGITALMSALVLKRRK